MERTSDRRDFLKTAGGTVVGLSLANRLTELAFAQEVATRTLLIADIIDIAPIDPAQYTHTIGRTMIRNVYEPLTYYKLGGYTTEPRLATSWSKSRDGRKYTAKLRRGVKFHSGAAFTARDVKATFDRVLAIGQNVPTASLSGSLKSVDVIDDYTVRFNLTYPYAYFIDILPKIPIVSAADVQEHQVGKNWAHAWFLKNANGTGPYKFAQWNPGQNYTLARNADWWGKLPPLAYDRVYMQVITDGSQQRQMLERGQLNLVSDWISVFTKIAAAKGAPSAVKLVNSKGLMQLLLLQNASKPPLTNKLVRQAMLAAFPYERMQSYYQGYASRPIGVLASNYPGVDASAYSPVKQDLNKARSLLKRAGHPKGGFTLQYYFDQGSEEKNHAGLLFQGALKELGIKLKVTGVPGATWFTQGSNAKTAGHFNPHYEAAETPDPFQWINKMFGKKGYLNWTYLNVPAIDKIIHDGQHSSDARRRKKLLNQAMRVLADEATAIPMSRFNILHAMSKSVQGYVFDPLDLQGVPKFWTMHSGS